MSTSATNPSQEDEFRYGKKYSYCVLALLTMLMAFDFVDRSVIASLLGSLRAEWHLSDKQIGLLIAMVNIALAVLALPTAILVDRWSRKKMVGIMALIWGFASLGCAFVSNFFQLMVLRFIVGAGEAGYNPGSSSIIQRYFPAKKINSAIAILQSGSMIGSVSGMIIGGIIVKYWGWRHAFGIVAIPGIILALLAFFIKEPVRDAITRVNTASGQTEKIPVMSIVKKLVTTRTTLMVYLAMALSLLFSICLTNWMPLYFSRVDGLDPQSAAFKGSTIVVCKGVGMVLGGFICDWANRKLPQGHLICAAIFMATMSVGYALAFLVIPQAYTYPFLLLSGLLASTMLAPALNTVMQVNHKGLHATAIGMMIVVQNMFGMALGATVSGMLSDFYKNLYLNGTLTINSQILAANNGNVEAASVAMGLKTAMGTMSFSPLLAAGCFLLAARFYCRDRERREEM